MNRSISGLLLSSVVACCAQMLFVQPCFGVSGHEAHAGATVVGPSEFTSTHSGRFGGVKLDYRATVAATVVPDEEGRPGASLVTIAYTRVRGKAIQPDSGRPVTFAFNGGPGSASVWLHMGGIGPRRVATPPGGVELVEYPYPLEDNIHSLLDVTDLVFIDPVGAGFSHALPPHKNADYRHLIRDAKSFTDLIRQWLVKHGRTESPIYLLGESYGSVRMGPLVDQLRRSSELPVRPRGVILLGQDMDTTITQQAPGNDMPYVVYLPTYAATAWWHGKIRGESLEQVYEEAKAYARTDFAAALFLGSRIAPSHRRRVAERVAELTSLPVELIEAENLRVGTLLFQNELLRERGKMLVRFDTRYTLPAVDLDHGKATRSFPEGLVESYKAGNDAYLRHELGVTLDAEYRFSSNDEGPWDYTLPDNLNPQQTYHNVAPYITAAMLADPELRLFTGSGHYDMLAAPLSVERTITHSGLPIERVVEKNYPTGHMIFLDKPVLAALSADLRRFIRGESND